MPKQVNLPCKIKFLALGLFHALALSDDGEVFSWGSGASGQLGHNKLLNDVNILLHEKEPLKIAEFEDKKIMQISAGAKHSLALSQDGALYAWGCNKKGQLGLDEVKGALKPKQVKSVLEKYLSLSQTSFNCGWK
jgi:alpha-tubulin suppressor-like RCC1 family protein